MEIFRSFFQNPRNFKFESQEKHEQVYFLLRRHPITNLGWILAGIFFTFLPVFGIKFLLGLYDDPFKIVPSQLQLILLIIWYMLTLLFTFESFIIWYFNVYIITDKRVIDVDFTGFWGKRISEAPLNNVEDATYGTNNLWHILFDFGDISMQTAAEKPEFEFKSLPRPALVHDKLTELLE